MASSGIFTSKSLGMDNRVWATMLLIILLSAGLFAYSYKKNGEKKPCESIQIFVNGLSKTDTIFFTSGDNLRFRSYFSNTDDVVWNFGDDSEPVEGRSATHVFNKESIYTVRILLNGYCEYEKKIAIKAPAVIELDSSGNEILDIIGEERGFVGKSMEFSTPRAAENYEWYIENNHSYPPKSGDSISFVFRTAGTYILVLVLDKNRQHKIRKNIVISNPIGSGADKITPTKKIDITKLPPIKTDTGNKVNGNTSTPATSNTTAHVKTYKYVANEILKVYLQAVVCEKKSLEEFDEYLCEGKKTTVTENGKAPQDFESFYNAIKGKKIEIMSVIAGRDQGDCIVKLTVKLDRKGKLARHPCK
jgi:hypothetical protein